MLLEPPVVDDVPKGLLPDFALADVLVPIHARAQVGLGVVQMECEDLLEPNQRGDFTDRGIPAFGCSDVVAGGEEVRSIQTDAQAVGFSRHQ